MRCPRCKAKLQEVTQASILSGLNSGGSSAMIVSGQSCWKCGNWIEPSIENFIPVCPMPPKERSENMRVAPKGMTSKAYALELKNSVIPFFDTITELRRKAVPMSTIVSRLKIPIAAQTCFKYYSMLCEESGTGVPNIRKLARG